MQSLQQNMYEGYLSEIKDYKMRTHVTKLGLSNHILQFETGRHKKIPKECVLVHSVRSQ